MNMKNHKKKLKQRLAVIVAIMVYFSMMQIPVFAAEESGLTSEIIADSAVSSEETGEAAESGNTDVQSNVSDIGSGDSDEAGTQAGEVIDTSIEDTTQNSNEDIVDTSENSSMSDTDISDSSADNPEADNGEDIDITDEIIKDDEIAGEEDQKIETGDNSINTEIVTDGEFPEVMAETMQMAINQLITVTLDEPAGECTCEYMCVWFWEPYININSNCPVCSNATEEQLDPYTYDPDHPEDFVCKGKQAVIPGNNLSCKHNEGWKNWMPGGGSSEPFSVSCLYPATSGSNSTIECWGCGAKWLWKLDPNSSVDPSAHYYGKNSEPEIVKEATCTEDGLQHQICLLCGDKDETVIPAKGHQFGDDLEVVEATCLTDGSKRGTCTVCEEEVTEVIPAGGHKKPETGVAETPATCTKDGHIDYTCTVCGEQITEIIPAKGHVFPEGKDLQKQIKGVCKECNATAYRVYTYEDGATPSGSGYEIKLCAYLIKESNGEVYGVDEDGNRLEEDSFSVIINESLMGKVKARVDESGNVVMTRVVGYRNMDNDNAQIYKVGESIPYADVPGMFIDDRGSWGNYYSGNSYKAVYLKAVREDILSDADQGTGSGSNSEFISKDVEYDHAPSVPNPGLRKNITQTSDGITVESVYHENDTCTITYTIPEGYAEDTININATADVMAAYRLIQDKRFEYNGTQPGDTLGPVYINLVNKSDKKFSYADGSFVLQSESQAGKNPYIDPIYTFDGVIPDEACVPSRVSNGALRYLFGKETDLGHDSLTDIVLGEKLIEKGYENGIADLHKYYLDYYNSFFGKNYNTIWSNLSQVPYELLVNREQGIYGGQSSTAGVKETNPEVAGVGYSYAYTRLLCVIQGDETNLKDSTGEYAVGNYMKGLKSYNENAKSVWGSLDSNTSGLLTGMSMFIDGEANDFYQNTAYGIEIGFKLNKVDSVIPVEPQGSLTIIKNVQGGGSAAADKVYTFIVKDKDGKEIAKETAGVNKPAIITGLAPGKYTVTEDSNSAAIGGYRWSVTVSGEGVTANGASGTVEVKAGENAQAAAVTFTNTYRRPQSDDPTPSPTPENPTPSTPSSPGTPGRPSTPPSEVPDPDVPLTNIPEEEPPLTELPEEEPPLANIPDEEPPLADIPEEEPPLSEIPDDEVPLADIPDDEIPLDTVPQTGDNSHTILWMALMLFALCAIAGIVFAPVVKRHKR